MLADARGAPAQRPEKLADLLPCTQAALSALRVRAARRAEAGSLTEVSREAAPQRPLLAMFGGAKGGHFGVLPAGGSGGVSQAAAGTKAGPAGGRPADTMWRLRCKAKGGTHVLQGLSCRTRLRELQGQIAAITGIAPGSQRILVGYPPECLDLSDRDTMLGDLPIHSGPAWDILHFLHFPSGGPFHHPCALLQAMPKRELWPAGPCSEPGTHIGRCDSMMSATSTHSGSSDNSYDFLSAEEKECLLFLEKTIGSLEAEADSGLSTDESEPATSPGSFRALPITQQAPQGNPGVRDSQQEPTPKRVAHSSGPPESHGLGLRSGSYSLPRNLHFGRSQNLRESTTQTNSQETSEVLAEAEKGQASQSTKPIQQPAPSQQTALDLNTVLIPPPEAFQDIRPRQSGEESPPGELGEKRHTPQAGTLVSSPKKEEISSETMSHKATEKGQTESPQQPQLPPAQSSQNTRAEEAPLPSEVKPNTQQTPLTAPKPRRLPPNIVLKSSRSSFHSHPQNWLSNHTEAADSAPVPSSLQEQKKARREALEKLGLPQDQDDPSLLVKHTSTLKVREAQAQSPSRAQAVVQQAPPTMVPGAASAAGKTSPGKAVTPMASSGKRIPAQETPPGKVAAAKSLPIPIPKASKENSSLTRPSPDPRLTLQESSIPGLRQINFKSNTLERSGVGLSSYLSAAEKDPKRQTSTSLGKSPILDKASPSVLRNSRPRPASLGMGKDFAEIQGAKLVGLEQGQRSQQLSFKGQSQDKLPRPPCVSVRISPKGIPDGHRREALKKLGLLKE